VKIFYSRSGAQQLQSGGWAVFEDVNVKLWKAGEIELDKDTTKAALEAVECDFSGYTELGTVNMMATVINPPEGGKGIVSDLLAWLSTTATPFVSNSVGGFFVTDGPDLLLLVYVEFDSPIPIPAAGVPLQFAFTQRFGLPYIS